MGVEAMAESAALALVALVATGALAVALLTVWVGLLTRRLTAVERTLPLADARLAILDAAHARLVARVDDHAAEAAEALAADRRRVEALVESARSLGEVGETLGAAVDHLAGRLDALAARVDGHVAAPHPTPADMGALLLTLQGEAGVPDHALAHDFALGTPEVHEGPQRQKPPHQHDWRQQTVRSVGAEVQAIDVCRTCGPEGAVRVRRIR